MSAVETEPLLPPLSAETQRLIDDMRRVRTQDEPFTDELEARRAQLADRAVGDENYAHEFLPIYMHTALVLIAWGVPREEIFEGWPPEDDAA